MSFDRKGRASGQTAAALLLTALVAIAAPAPYPDDAKKKDPEANGARKVHSGITFSSVEKEIANGKPLAMEVHRQAKVLDGPIVKEYTNRRTQNLVRNSGVKFP